MDEVTLKTCKGKLYPEISTLPKTSVIIVFHNEAWTTLLRTVISVINRSPRQLLEEILLVDDASLPDRYWLHEDLEEFVAKLSVPTRVIRTGERVGLIQGRLIGVQEAKAEVVTFLDSHCECNIGWLEPLMAEIARDRSTVVAPIIDVISDKTFRYSFIGDTKQELIGGFGWWLEFKWFALPQRERDRIGNDDSAPRRTPTIAGGLFSIDKKYFHHLGLYDPGFDTWGAENLELSFRVWQCGGILETHPCSHVGHVFRSNVPYKYKDDKEPGLTLSRNNMRLLDVWMDDIKYFYMSLHPHYRSAEFGDTSERKILRKNLGCKDFNWYLSNIYPENTLPIKYTRLGPIKNIESGQCIDMYRRQHSASPVVVECHGMMTQVFTYNKHSNLQHDNLCLAASKSDNSLIERDCVNEEVKENPDLRWSYDWKMRTFVHMSTGKCLDRGEYRWINDGQFLTPLVTICNGKFSQQWIFENMPLVGNWKV